MKLCIIVSIQSD